MARRAGRQVVQESQNPADETEAERRRASGQDSVPPHVVGETATEAALFGQLPLEDREFLVKCRVDVERKVGLSCHMFFGIGDILNAAKARLPHGTYLTWVDKVLRIAARCSQNYSAAAATFVGEDVRETISFLGPSVIYKLSANDPRLAELRTRLLVEIGAGARPTGREVEEMIAEALGKGSPKVRKSAKSKDSIADPDTKDKIFDTKYEIDTEKVCSFILERCQDEIDVLMSLLKRAELERIGRILVNRCEIYIDCTDTHYSPIFGLEIKTSNITGLPGRISPAQNSTSA